MSNMSPGQQVSQQDGEINLSQVLHRLWVNKWLILIIMLSTLSLGIFYANRQVPLYQSELLLQINTDHPGVGIGLASRGPQQINFGFGQNKPIATQIALIKSRVILSPVVKSLALDILAVPKQSQAMKFLLPSHAKIKVTQFIVPRQDIGKPFTLVFYKTNRFNLYNSTKHLLLRGQVGHLAMNQDKTIHLKIDSVINLSANTTFSIMKIPESNIIGALKHQLNITDLGDNKVSTGILELTLSNPNPETAVLILNAIAKMVKEQDVQKNAEEALKMLEFLYIQLPITKKDLERSETKLNKYRSKSGKIDIKLQAEYLLKELTEVDKNLSELRINKIDMLQRYTTAHPYILALNTKLRESRADRTKLEKQLQKLPASDQIAVNLMRDVEVKNTLYMLLLNKIQELQVVKAGIVSDVRILALAKLPNDSLPQNRKLIYIAALIIGFILGLITIFARNLFYPRVDDPHWSERHFDLINLAIIPYSKEQFQNSSFTKAKTTKQLPLLSYVNPRNIAIESLRSLRTALQVRLSCEMNNIVSILGVSPGVGKTFVSANLAYLLATAGKRVVLVDTDMRRGTLHKYFNLLPTPGLSELLNHKISLDEALMPTLHENLMVLPRGAYPTDPSELLTTDSFKDNILTPLSQQFDIVVIDTPPVLLVTDAVLISVHSDTNYLVVGANSHQPIDIEMSIKRLLNGGVTLHGSIFNFHRRENTGKNGYGYGYGYGYGHNYYYDDKETSK